MLSEADISFVDHSDEIIEVVDRPIEKHVLQIRWLTAALIVVLGATAMMVGWVIFQEVAKRRLLHELSVAATTSNIHAFVSGTDWQSIRDTLRQDLKQRATTSASLPQQAKTIDRLVDYYVRPESVPMLLAFYQKNAGTIRPEAFMRHPRFTGLAEITMDIVMPPQFDKPWLNNLEPVHAVFALDVADLGWKLKKIDAPDYLIPTRLPKTARF